MKFWIPGFGEDDTEKLIQGIIHHAQPQPPPAYFPQKCTIVRFCGK